MNEKSPTKIAVYSRKSKFTGKGESIENQIELCKMYIATHFPEFDKNNILVFEDEGYSGGHLDRPKFKEMMELVKKKEVSHIVCYRLDRVSRNISDFASLITEFNSLSTDFISVKENFDTSSPIGRAMMYISSIFSQLERETIAERIRDNMRELAKTGRWLGGTTPTGYKSEEIEKITIDGKAKKAFKLVPINDEVALVKLIFSKYLENNSLTKTETFLIQNGYKSKNGKDFSKFALRNILSNPVYMIADKAAFEFFEKQNIEIFSDITEFDSKSGLMAYNKTIQQKGKTNKIREMSDWIIAVGKHEGIISGADFAKAHYMLNENKGKSQRKPRSNVALLSGIVVCKNCGSPMRPKLSQRRNVDGQLSYQYLCTMKERSRMSKCDMKNPSGNTLDKLVCDEIKKLSSDSSLFFKELEEQKRRYTADTSSVKDEITRLNNQKKQLEEDISKLTKTLVKVADTPAEIHVLNEIKELDDTLRITENSIIEYQNIIGNTVMTDSEFDLLKDLLINFSLTFEDMTIEQKRMAIKTFVRKIVWDGENAHIYLFGSAENELESINHDDLIKMGEFEPINEDRK